MIRNVVRTAGIAALVVAFAAAAAITQPTVKTNKATVTFSGKLSLASVYRSSEYFTATTGDGTNTNPGGIPFVEQTNGEIVSGSPPRHQHPQRQKCQRIVHRSEPLPELRHGCWR